MQKTTFQIATSIFLIAAFLFGSYIVFPTAWAVFNQVTHAEEPMGMQAILILLIYGLFILAQLAMLFAAIQLYQKNNASLLRKLLYFSIPSFNLMGLVVYSFAFGPFLIFNLGIDTQAYGLSFGLNFQLFSVMYDLSFAGSSNMLSFGINIIPIIFLKLMSRWGY